MLVFGTLQLFKARAVSFSRIVKLLGGGLRMVWQQEP